MLVGPAMGCEDPTGCDRHGQYPGVVLVCIVELYDGGRVWLPGTLVADHIVKRDERLITAAEGTKYTDWPARY